MITLFDFRTPEAASGWRAIDDRVMGGLSLSQLQPLDGYASFTGTVSPENNGGFCSVRTRVATQLPADTEHLWIEARGEAKRYSLNLRMDDAWDGISYRADWESISTTDDRFIRLELPLTDFQPTFRGREVRGAPTLDPRRIQQLGLMIANRQWGRFRVDVRAIGAQ